MKEKSPLLVIFLVVFIDLLGFGIVIPILPYFAKEFGASARTLGFLMASYSAMQFIFSPIWGSLSDKIGRRSVILISLLGGTIAFSILGFAKSLMWLFAGRILSGITSANISTASAYITDITTPENRAKGMGLIGASFGLGFIFGPAIGGLLFKYGYSAPMFAAALLSLIDFILAFFILKEPKVHTPIQKRKISGIKNVLTDPRAFYGVLLFFLSTLAFTQVEVSFALFMLSRFQFNATQSGMMLALMGVVGAIIQGGLIGKLSKKFGEVNLIFFGFIFLSLGLLGVSLTYQIFVTSLFIVLSAIGNGCVNPSLSSLTSQGAQEETRGAVMGIYQAGSALARILGPLLGGYLFDKFGEGTPFSVAALFYLIGIFIIFYFKIASKKQIS
jgi:DHA1 family tetracycline resistance protein-like MFS transporter